MIWNFLGADPVFWFCALSGTAFFALQLLLSLFGVGDVLGDEGEELPIGEIQWFSKRTVTGFLMMFGWIGLTCKKEFDLPVSGAVLIAFVGGVLALFLIGYLLRLAQKLKSPGSVFRIEEAVGKEATVYHRIPVEGSGKVTLSLNNLSYEVDAISQNTQEIPAFTRVHVLKKIDHKTVMVSSLEEK
ncbi:MAG: hypothetical protein KGI80_04565 [Verrucomicrobiota bacterium]|nr:hypothetical protein [Verrucomicrobiota bacterium]